MARKKRFVFWHESRRAGKILIIVNNSIKETENFDCFIIRSNFISFVNTKIWISLVKNLVLVFIRWNKILSCTTKIKYPLYYVTWLIHDEKKNSYDLLIWLISCFFKSFVLSYYVICSLFQTFNYETFIAVLKPGLYLWSQQQLTGW